MTSTHLNSLNTPIVLPQGYKPSDGEKYMNPQQAAYFRQKLLTWREELLKESIEIIHHLQEEVPTEPDLADQASVETDRTFELRTRDRARKLINKIEAAIKRIDEGTYGYCEETGEPIGIRRLEARPIATLTIEAQEIHEKMEKLHREE